MRRYAHLRLRVTAGFPRDSGQIDQDNDLENGNQAGDRLEPEDFPAR